MKETITYTDSVGDERELRTVWWFPTRHKEGKGFRYAKLFEAPGVLGGGAYGLDVHEAECAGQDPQRARCALMLVHKDIFEAGFADTRVKLLLAQVPGGSTYLKGGLDSITTPTLLTTGGRDLSLPLLAGVRALPHDGR